MAGTTEQALALSFIDYINATLDVFGKALNVSRHEINWRNDVAIDAIPIRESGSTMGTKDAGSSTRLTSPSWTLMRGPSSASGPTSNLGQRD